MSGGLNPNSSKVTLPFRRARPPSVPLLFPSNCDGRSRKAVALDSSSDRHLPFHLTLLPHEIPVLVEISLSCRQLSFDSLPSPMSLLLPPSLQSSLPPPPPPHRPALPHRHIHSLSPTLGRLRPPSTYAGIPTEVLRRSRLVLSDEPKPTSPRRMPFPAHQLLPLPRTTPPPSRRLLYS